MDFRLLSLLFYFMIFLTSLTNIFGMPIPKFQKKNDTVKKIKETPRGLQEQNKSDSYMVLYFSDDCNYSKGFKNEYRNNIRFIVNRQNGLILSDEEVLDINKDSVIEIHFDLFINNLSYFFSIDYVLRHNPYVENIIAFNL